MKVKMARHSGLPVQEVKADEYRRVWKNYYDKVLDKYAPDMEKVQERLEKLSNILNRRYKTIIDVELPKNSKQWKEFLAEYGNFGLCVTTDLDQKEIRLILLDQGL
jgi:formate dehydrogenase maturation protein FdhE